MTFMQREAVKTYIIQIYWFSSILSVQTSISQNLIASDRLQADINPVNFHLIPVICQNAYKYNPQFIGALANIDEF